MTKKQLTPTIFSNPLPQTVSKAQEIELLRTIAANIPDTWYLRDLFNDRLIEWVDSQIQMDIMPDMTAELDSVTELRNSEGYAAANHIRRLEAELQSMTSARDLYRNQEDQTRAKLLDEGRRFMELSERYDEMVGENNRLRDQLNAAQNENLRLKGEVYDYRYAEAQRVERSRATTIASLNADDAE